MGVVWIGHPWHWDLWNTPLEPDDDEASAAVYRQKLDEALEAGREGEEKLAEKLLRSNS